MPRIPGGGCRPRSLSVMRSDPCRRCPQHVPAMVPKSEAALLPHLRRGFRLVDCYAKGDAGTTKGAWAETRREALRPGSAAAVVFPTAETYKRHSFDVCSTYPG